MERENWLSYCKQAAKQGGFDCLEDYLLGVAKRDLQSRQMHAWLLHLPQWLFLQIHRLSHQSHTTMQQWVIDHLSSVCHVYFDQQFASKPESYLKKIVELSVCERE